MEVEFVDGPCDGMRRPQPMLGDLPASLVEVTVPARYDSMLDTCPAARAETHLYRRVLRIGAGRVLYEWRGHRAYTDVDLYRRRPRRSY